jgi:LacI family transcriptional regulator
MYHRLAELPEKISRVPVALANCFAVNLVLPSVVPDEFGGGYTATKALLARGHRRIGFINVNQLEPGIPASIGRWRGYKAALEESGVPYDEAWYAMAMAMLRTDTATRTNS